MTNEAWVRRPTLVGERGPELLDLPPGTQIIPKPDGGDDE